MNIFNCTICGNAIYATEWRTRDGVGYKHMKCVPQDALTEAQRQHLNSIKNSFTAAVESKYTEGVKEHGGNLWEKSNLLDEAMKEVIDLYVYLHTLRQQLHDTKQKT